MFLSDISIKRPIMMSMFLIVFVLFGGLMYTKMNLEFTRKFPCRSSPCRRCIREPRLAEIETQVTKKIEDAVSSVSQIDYIQSYSMENVSYRHDRVPDE